MQKVLAVSISEAATSKPDLKVHDQCCKWTHKQVRLSNIQTETVLPTCLRDMHCWVPTLLVSFLGSSSLV